MLIEAVLEFVGWLLLTLVEAVADYLILRTIWSMGVRIGWRRVLILAGLAIGANLAMHYL